LIRSPMIANGWSSPMRTVLVAEDRMVCTDFLWACLRRLFRR
jgi:hypothetical protein